MLDIGAVVRYPVAYLTKAAELSETLRMLESQEMVVKTNAGAEDTPWHLTPKGISSIHIRREAASPTLVFRVRPSIASCDRTAYELQLTLGSAGFTWHEWVPLSRRRKGNVPLPITYGRESEKIWMSTGKEVSRPYLRCLVDVEAEY